MSNKLVSLISLFVLACAGDPEQAATLGVKSYVDQELGALHEAASALCAAAPEPDADGWSAADDAAAIATMRAEWRRARVAYEHIEGAIAVLFPHIDTSIDQRYDFFIEQDPDTSLFDDQGATGMHAIERILWAGEHPPQVIAFESAIAGYEVARLPANEAEARAFRDSLCARMVADVEVMQRDFAPLALDPAAAYRGVVGSMAEQREKVRLAATGEDESRYSQITLSDMRANLEGGRAIYSHFTGWVRAQPDGAGADASVLAGLDRLDAGYDAIAGDAMPAVPAGWDPSAPDPAHLQTDYGRLWTLVDSESDPARPSSLVQTMVQAAALIGIPVLP